jgi:hypothetical protein
MRLRPLFEFVLPWECLNYTTSCGVCQEVFQENLQLFSRTAPPVSVLPLTSLVSAHVELRSPLDILIIAHLVPFVKREFQLFLEFSLPSVVRHSITLGGRFPSPLDNSILSHLYTEIKSEYCTNYGRFYCWFLYNFSSWQIGWGMI